ncbi:MAG: VWA domain-containing protein [Thermomicrobiales bacterium]|nr:VWA domain-containing protein [Thermomicrobiales bacterium]
MVYEALATSRTPAMIVYVLDVSASMTRPLGGKRRIDVVTDALRAALQRMVFLSTKGTRVAPRYRIAMYAYSDHVYDLLDGVKTVDQVVRLGVPQLTMLAGTDTARAFEHVERLLRRELSAERYEPAPLVCHMTDGDYTGDDPAPIARRIMEMRSGDGNVLIENIFISDRILPDQIPNPKQWSGIQRATPLIGEYADKLRAMSSPLPESYRTVLLESGYQLTPGAVMMLPGMSAELVEMGFVMSTSTPVTR